MQEHSPEPAAHSSTPPAGKPKQKRSAGRRLWRVIKWTLVTLLTLIVLMLVLAYYLLGTESGYKQMPKLVNALTPFTLTYDNLEGKLLGEQRWRGFHLTGENGLDVKADAFIMDFRFKELFSKHLHISVLQLTDSTVKLPPPAEKQQTPSAGIPRQLPQINLPLQIDVDALRVSDLAIFNAQDERTLLLERLNAGLHGEASNVKFTADTAAVFGEKDKETQANATLDGNISLKDDYPLNLTGEGSVALPEKPVQDVNIAMQGSVLHPDLSVTGKGWTSGSMTLKGDISLENQNLDVTLSWKDVDYDGKVVFAPSGEVQLKGPFDNIAVKMDTSASGSAIPGVVFAGGADVTDEAIKNANFLVQTLGGKITFDGSLRYKNGIAWDGTLLITDIDAKQYKQDLDASISGEIITSGRQTPEGLDAVLEIKKLDGRWQQQPVNGGGKITVAGKTVNVDNFFINFAGNNINAAGRLDESGADLTVNIDALALSRIVSGLTGSVTGKAVINGNPQDPTINSNVRWQNLKFSQNGKTLFASNAGNAKASGTVKDLDVAINAEARGDGIPAMKLRGTAKVTPEQIQNIDLSADTLDGNIKLAGTVDLTPEIAWDVTGKLTGINPQEFSPDLKGKISGDLQAKGGFTDGKVNTTAQLTNLSGSWQGQPLSGALTANISNNSDIAVDNMDLSVGGNRLTGKGGLSGDKLNFSFELAGKQLAQLYPPLKGTLSGKGTITGTTKAPVIQADLTGQNIAYQENRAAKADIYVNTGMQTGGAFDNRIVITGVSAAGQRWQRVTFTSSGRFENHEFSLSATGGEYNADLKARGGFKAQNSWAGTLQTLTAQLQNLNWRMTKPTQAAFSPQEIRLDDFCLADQYSSLCVKIAKKTDTLIDYDIARIDPRSLKPFLPDNVRITGSELKGKGRVTIAANGGMKGNADAQITPGRIVVTVPNKPPITLRLQNATLNGTFTDTQAQGKLDVDFVNAGHIQAQGQVSNLKGNPQLRGRVQINVPDIGKFKYLIPQVSELKGTVTGDMQFAGPLSRPQAAGQILLNGGKVVIPEYAAELNNIRLRLNAQRGGNIGIDGNIGTPKGSLTANGVLRLQPLKLDLKLDGKDMLIANSKEMRIIVTPSFTIGIDPNTGIVVKGNVLVPQANISIPDTSKAVEPSEDVVIVTEGYKRSDTPYVADSTPLQADITVRLGNKVFFKNKDVNIRLKGGVTAVVRPGQSVQGRGRIEVAQGVYELYGQELDIKRGWVTFSGPIGNPAIDVLAAREVDKVSVGAHITGTVQRLRLDLTSDPAMPDSAILSYLLFGRPPDSGTDSTALLQAAATVGTKGLFPDDLAGKTGLDVFDLGIGGLKAGKYLFKDVYVGMKSNFFTGVTKFLARYQITDRLSVEASSSPKDGSAVDMTYQFETD